MKPTKDLFVECNEGGLLSPAEFENTFCNQCKNRSCVRAGWAFSSWDKRILTQVDRLLENPLIVPQTESNRWDGIDDFDLFNEPQTIEVWGVPEKSPLEIKAVEVREEADTTPTQDVEPPSVEEEPSISAPPSVAKYTNPLNTPPQEILIGGSPQPAQPTRPKNYQADPWAVTETLPVGGKFKMGK